MKKNIAVSLLILLLASFSMGGFTIAWFTTVSDPLHNVFTAGTVRINDPTLTPDSILTLGSPSDLTWEITNTGSKGSYIRVKPDFTITPPTDSFSWSSAWLRTEGDTPIGDGHYSVYTIGSGSVSNPVVASMRLNGWTNDVGQAEVWNNGTHVFIRCTMFPGIEMGEIKLYLGVEPPKNHAPGQMGFDYYAGFNTGADAFATDYVFREHLNPNRIHRETNRKYVNTFAQGDKIFIISHATVTLDPSLYEEADWYPSPTISSSWILGEDGWWYYGTDSGPTRVEPGETISITFTFDTAPFFSGDIDLLLEAEAVQASNNAIHYMWPENPWNQ